MEAKIKMATSLTLDNLIQLTSQGIDVMDYADIVQTYLNEFKGIYGQEIELDPRSGDGRFLYDRATVTNNELQVISQFYSQMNPSTATGYILDILSSLTNVEREAATSSQIKAKISNPTSSDITITNANYLSTADDSGNTWTAQSDVTIPLKIQANSYVYITYTASVTGKYNTSSLAFAVLNEQTSPLKITIETFSVGSAEETDNSLRYRRASDSSYGITVLEGVQGKLKKVFGVKDCYIQSYAGNVDESNICYVDNRQTSMPLHSVSILVRYDKINEPTKSRVAETIKNNITPSVMTNGTTYFNNLTDSGIVTQTRWYVVNKTTPTIIITLNNLYNFAGITTAQSIAASLVDYLNNLKINQTYNISQITSVIQGADPKYMSRATFDVGTVSGLWYGSERLNKGCYFDYGTRLGIDYSVTLSDDNTTITIKAL